MWEPISALALLNGSSEPVSDLGGVTVDPNQGRLRTDLLARLSKKSG
jgi:hypothetical protein